MDDPLTGLDFKLGAPLRRLERLQESLQATVVYTTSDPLEALMLAHQVSVLDGGRIVESGPLEQVYATPQHARTMRLLGFPQASLFAGSLSADQRSCDSALFKFAVKLNGTATLPQDVTVGIRPQDIRLGEKRNDGWLARQAAIMLTEDLGGELVAYLDADGLPLIAVVRMTKRT
jgi:ABC-type sugar transport system ATPase subunit